MFNPALPLENSELKSAEMRDQFTGLKDLIDADATREYVVTRTGGAFVNFDLLLDTPVQVSTEHDMFVMVAMNFGPDGQLAVHVGPDNPPNNQVFFFIGEIERQNLGIPVPRGHYLRLQRVAGTEDDIALQTPFAFPINL